MAGYESGINKYDGITVIKTNTCNGNGAQTDNIFKVSGTVRVIELGGICTESTDATTLSGCSFALYDATPETVEITDGTAPTDASGLGVGGGLYSNGASASVAVAYITSDACTVTDVVKLERILNQKPGVDTYIQFLFTGDATTDVDIQFFCRYVPLSSGAEVTAV